MTGQIKKKRAICIYVLLISILVVVCGLLVSFFISSKDYFLYVCKQSGTLDYMTWQNEGQELISYTQEDLEVIIQRVVDYLSLRNDDMQVVIDSKYVFSNQAILHMQDVQVRIIALQSITAICGIAMILSAVYVFRNFKPAEIIRATKIYCIVLAILLIGIAVAAIVDFSGVFRIFHRIVFPIEEDFCEAYFGEISIYDELPYINNLVLLNLFPHEYFTNIAIIAGIAIVITYACVFFILWVVKKVDSKKQRNAEAKNIGNCKKHV